jgi:hypothetical protein
MPNSCTKSSPNLIKDSNNNILEIHHNHFLTIDYLSYQTDERDKKRLDQLLDQQKVALKGCITFFKTIAEHKNSDPILAATAKGVVEEDEARLKDFDKHHRKTTNCTIL